LKGRPFERENEGIDDDDDHELFAVAEVLVVVGRRRDDNDAANPLREEIMRGVDIIRFIIEISTGVLDRNRSRLFVAQASNILWRDEGSLCLGCKLPKLFRPSRAGFTLHRSRTDLKIGEFPTVNEAIFRKWHYPVLSMPSSSRLHGNLHR
jgi:hypothetical protein